MSTITSNLSIIQIQVTQIQFTASGTQSVDPQPYTHDSRFHGAFAKAALAAGVDPSKVRDLQKQVRQAIHDARKTAAPGEQRQAVQDAVANVLQQNGVDVARFQEALRAQLQKGPHHGRGHEGHAVHRHHRHHQHDGDATGDDTPETSGGGAVVTVNPGDPTGVVSDPDPTTTGSAVGDGASAGADSGAGMPTPGGLDVTA